MEKSYFTLEKAEKTYCPNCGDKVYRLTDNDRVDSPSFNICFKCQFVGHIGVGIVEIKEDDE